MFSENLRKRRLELGISQSELAEKLGYRSRSSITKLESGISDIPQKKLKLLAGALDTTPEALIGTGNAQKPENAYNAKQKSGNESRVIVLIMAGGKSTRNMLNIPNQFVNVDDKPIIAYVLETYERHPRIDEIDVICLYGWEKTVKNYAKEYHITKLNKIVTGGNTIVDSVSLGMRFLENEIKDDDIVILQESTRPMINIGLISKIISCYNTFGDSVFVKSMSEYVQIAWDGKRVDLCDRKILYSLESPDIYAAKNLKASLKKQRKEVKDDGSCCAVLMNRLGVPLHFCENTAINLKIVRQEDLYYFKVLKQVIL